MVGMCGNNSLTNILTAMTMLESENCSGGQDRGKQVENKKGEV